MNARILLGVGDRGAAGGIHAGVPVGGPTVAEGRVHLAAELHIEVTRGPSTGIEMLAELHARGGGGNAVTPIDAGEVLGSFGPGEHVTLPIHAKKVSAEHL